MNDSTIFEDYLTRWVLTPDGDPIITRSSRLLPVRWNDQPAMLKIAIEAEEKRGGQAMVWWRGKGTARVLKHEGDALLMERAMGTRSLAEMAHNGCDDEASRIMCSVAGKLHGAKHEPPMTLIPLSRRFAELGPTAENYGGVVKTALAFAQELLAAPQDTVVLHGDLHHGNVLDAGSRWLAIDPKWLVGERGFDFANIFCNPDLEVATRPGRLARQASVVAETAVLDRQRLLRWILAWSGLSAAWMLSDGEAPTVPLAVAELAAAELTKSAA